MPSFAQSYVVLAFVNDRSRNASTLSLMFTNAIFRSVLRRVGFRYRSRNASTSSLMFTTEINALTAAHYMNTKRGYTKTAHRQTAPKILMPKIVQNGPSYNQNGP